MEVYLDNASTSFPKPKSVSDCVYNCLVSIGGNAGRGIHNSTLKSNRIILDTRENIASFFNFDKSENVIFTNNITTSLNTLIYGILKKGDHVITSSMEHNAVIRPLYDLHNNKVIDLDIVKTNNKGILDVKDVENAINKNTKLIILTHASNVVGAIQPIKLIGEICKKNKIFFVLDTAQTAGVLDIDFKDLNLSALAFTGHKSLLGPQGIGGFIISDELNNICKSYILGGTGSLSHSLVQPNFLPDKFESGTLNLLGIAGLNEGIKFIKKEKLISIYEHNKILRSKFINDIKEMKDYELHGETDFYKSTSCVSITSSKFDVSELSFYLESDFNIKTRSGLHCAPLAHKSLNTYPNGTVRFSIGYFNTEKEIKYTIDALKKLTKSY